MSCTIHTKILKANGLKGSVDYHITILPSKQTKELSKGFKKND